MNVYKDTSFYIKLIFTPNQFYEINSFKIIPFQSKAILLVQANGFSMNIFH